MKKLDVINGLRGFAILAVVYHHLFYEFTPAGTMPVEVAGFTLLPFAYLSNGWFGVNLFFILSGFVLAYPYFLGKRNFNTNEDIKYFYIHRAKRLLPLYYISVIFSVIFIIHPGESAAFIKQVILMATITFNFTLDEWYPRYNWVLWSLGIEVWFSIIFPFLILAIHKFGIIKVLIATYIVSLITRIIGNDEIFTINGPYLNPVRDSLLGRLDEFLLGMYLCYLYTNKLELIKRMNTSITFVTGFVLITVACMLWDYVILEKISKNIVPYINIVLDLGLFSLTLSLLIMRTSIIRWFFSNYIAQLLGVMCYSLYIWHGLAISNIITKYDAVHVIGYFLMTFTLSAFTYRYIEFGREPNWKKLFLLDNKKT